MKEDKKMRKIKMKIEEKTNELRRWIQSEIKKKLKKAKENFDVRIKKQMKELTEILHKSESFVKKNINLRIKKIEKLKKRLKKIEGKIKKVENENIEGKLEAYRTEIEKKIKNKTIEINKIKEHQEKILKNDFEKIQKKSNELLNKDVEPDI